MSLFALSVLAASATLSGIAASAQDPNTVVIHWDKVIATSRTTPTLQIVVNPMTRPGSPIHDSAFAAVKQLGADYVRYVPWLPYPKLAVAELEPPTSSKTSWEFSLIDPMTKDFFAATEGHPGIVNFSTMPAWLFKSDKPVAYPADPNQVAWDYTQGTELRDPSGKELGDYYARLVSWYSKGGFTDENGVRHDSGYHFAIPVWEVLNEPEYEHATTPQQYTERYDAIVSAIHRVSPDTKFMGLALAMPSKNPEYFEYFLDPKSHKPGIPLDYISYHFYASPTAPQGIDDWQYTFFDQADGFLNTVRYVEATRKRLSPQTKTDLNELGSILADGAGQPDHLAKPYPEAYWNLSGALFAYLYIELAKQQIDIVGESQLVGYPSQFPSVTMVDWVTGKPNARFWVLKLLKDSFHPGDKLVDTALNQGDVEPQAFITPAGRRLLLVNKRNRSIDVTLPEADNASASAVDPTSANGPARPTKINAGKITLEPFSVTVVSW